MKRFSLESIVNAYIANKKNTTNKFWAILSILYSVDDIVKPCKSYKVNKSDMSSFLDSLFLLSSETLNYKYTETFITFSKEWREYVLEKLLVNNKAYLNDIIIWTFRKETFEDSTTYVDIIKKFAEYLHIGMEDLNFFFKESESNTFSFQMQQYTEDDLFYEIKEKLKTNFSSRNLTAEGKSVAKTPGDSGAGPFLQPLYAAQDISKCLLITNKSLDDMYINKGDERVLNPALANFITQHDKEIFTDDQLSDILKKMCLNGKMDKNLAKHMFGILYAPHLQSKNISRIVSKALPGEANVEEGKGKNIGIYLRNYIKALSNYARKQEECDINTNYLDALRTKPFMLLAGISGTGKSRIVREFAFKSCPTYLRDKDGTTPGNYCMIEVKPNWHDSSELLGYYSNISGKYIFSNFAKFLVKALMFPKVPFFVCLDEMNLAPVEQYFAEFLSVLETRKFVDGTYNFDRTINKVVKTSNLIKPEHFQRYDEKDSPEQVISDYQWFERFFPELAKEVPADKITKGCYIYREEKEGDPVFGYSDYGRLRYEGLTLPENVFVIGTVNMDDTTHQFSRKVIDRAMTIEMNGGDLEDMFGGSSDLEYPTESDDNILSMATLKARYVSADDVLEKCEKIKTDEVALKYVVGKDAEGKALSKDEETLPRRLNAINDILENTPFQVSYRVFNELVIYLAVLCDDEANKDKTVMELAATALDQIALMKILPRIEGDFDMFSIKSEDDKNETRTKLDLLQEIFPKDKTKSGDKIYEMIKRLNSTGFTRFWP